MKSGLGDRNNDNNRNVECDGVPNVSMKSGLGDRNNPLVPGGVIVIAPVSMKSGLGDRNNIS